MISIKRLGSNCFPTPGKNSNSESDFNFNGYEYVDLGLPSGTLWAKMNIGANSETDYGLYFAWGETQGYTTQQVGTDKIFNWNSYKFGSNINKYNSTDNLTRLEVDDDAANTYTGGDWHIPTSRQFEELLNTDYVNHNWITNYQESGINGVLFTSVSNGNTLFIPAAGQGRNSEIESVGEYSTIWSSDLSSSDSNAVSLSITSSDETSSTGFTSRRFGKPIRGVVGSEIYIEPEIDDSPLIS